MSPAWRAHKDTGLTLRGARICGKRTLTTAPLCGLRSRALPRHLNISLNTDTPQEPPLVRQTSTTVSLTSIDHVAAWASIESFHDGACQYVAQRGDGIGHVALRALGCRVECNLGVSQALLIERSFFYSHYVEDALPARSRTRQYTRWRDDESRASPVPRSGSGRTPA